MKYLIRYCINWADEFDISGFEIMDPNEYLCRIKAITHFFEYEEANMAGDKDANYGSYYEFETYFGTNEYLTWTLDKISKLNEIFPFKEIGDEDADIIVKHLGTGIKGAGSGYDPDEGVVGSLFNTLFESVAETIYGYYLDATPIDDRNDYIENDELLEWMYKKFAL